MANLIKNVIVVNQTGSEFYLPTFLSVIFVPTIKISAASARNLGASNASAEYILFLDDDAWLDQYNEHQLRAALYEHTDLISLKRWDVKSNFHKRPNIYNIPYFFIEWNIIVNRLLFKHLGGFPEIGVGSKHLAQSGECFILVANIMNKKNVNVKAITTTIIKHPSLDIGHDNTKLCGYLFGLGYAVGVTINNMSTLAQFYWFLRILFAFSKRFLRELCLIKRLASYPRLTSPQILRGFLFGVYESRK